LFSIIGGDFCSLWIGSISDALSMYELEDNHKMINIRFLWLRALFNLQNKETGLTCDLLNMVILNFYFLSVSSCVYIYKIIGVYNYMYVAVPY